MVSEEMGGTALEDRSDMGMMCSLELSEQRSPFWVPVAS